MTARAVSIALLSTIAVIACGGSSQPSPHVSTAASIAVQPSDLPSGLSRCGLSGDIDSFLAKEKAADPSTYASTVNDWQTARQKGATAAYTAFYSDTAAHCTAVGTNGADVGAASYKLIVNFVIRFKDEKSAADGFQNGSVFGFSASSLKSGGMPVIEGTRTGLGPNSIALTADLPPQTFYVVLWQSKAFVVVLAVVNIDAGTGRKAALAENSRIK